MGLRRRKRNMHAQFARFFACRKFAAGSGPIPEKGFDSFGNSAGINLPGNTQNRAVRGIVLLVCFDDIFERYRLNPLNFAGCGPPPRCGIEDFAKPAGKNTARIIFDPRQFL